MKTLRTQLDELSERGFRQQLEAEDGELCSSDGTLRFEPERLVIRERHVFEGQSDPADASVLFALEEPKTGTKATWILRRGAAASPSDVQVAEQLTEASAPRDN